MERRELNEAHYLVPYKSSASQRLSEGGRCVDGYASSSAATVHFLVNLGRRRQDVGLLSCIKAS